VQRRGIEIGATSWRYIRGPLPQYFTPRVFALNSNQIAEIAAPYAAEEEPRAVLPCPRARRYRKSQNPTLAGGPSLRGLHLRPIPLLLRDERWGLFSLASLLTSLVFSFPGGVVCQFPVTSLIWS
jgi:hypothetical protein